jgi:hypothetical protein
MLGADAASTDGQDNTDEGPAAAWRAEVTDSWHMLACNVPDSFDTLAQHLYQEYICMLKRGRICWLYLARKQPFPALVLGFRTRLGRWISMQGATGAKATGSYSRSTNRKIRSRLDYMRSSCVGLHSCCNTRNTRKLAKAKGANEEIYSSSYKPLVHKRRCLLISASAIFPSIVLLELLQQLLLTYSSLSLRSTFES